MDENRVKQLIAEAIAADKQKAQFSVNRTSYHLHSGAGDAPNVPCNNVTGFQSLPALGTGVLSLAANQNVSGPPTSGKVLNPPQIVVFPIPIIYSGGTMGGFPGGEAPNGTLIFYDTANTVTSALWVRTESGWYGIPPTTLI